MKLLMSYEIHNPTTVSDHGVTIKYTYCGTKEEIDKIIEYCRENIGALTVADLGEVIRND